MSDIAKIDKNFDIKILKIAEKEYDVYPIPNKKADLYGVFYENGSFYRIPYKVAEGVSEAVKAICSKTAGGRVRFSTDSRRIQIIAKWPLKCLVNQMPPSAISGFTLQEDFEDGSNRYVYTYIPPKEAEYGFTYGCTLRGKKLRHFTLYFPLYNDVSELKILVDKGSIFEKGLPYKDIKPILYYGSSITQGGCASRPDNNYEALICKNNNIDYINLGFSGGCRAEESLIRYIAGIDASVFVCDYDHNASDAKYLEQTHYRLYKIYRSINPNTPILFISMPNYHTTDKNPKPRLKIIKETYEKALAKGDKKVYFLDGRKLFKREYNLCTVDGVHPNDLGFYFMAKAISKELDKILKGNKEVFL